MKYLDTTLITRLREQAAASPRKRAHHSLHPAPEDAIQRLCMALEPGTYIRPHRHPEVGKFELLVALAGRVAWLGFDADGTVTERAELAAGGELCALESPPACWHTLAALEPGTVVLEVKPGPYLPAADKDFAAWAPAEGESRAAEFERWFRAAAAGARPPALD